MSIDEPASPVTSWQTSPLEVQCTSGNNGENPGTVIFRASKSNSGIPYQTSPSGGNCTSRQSIELPSACDCFHSRRFTMLMMKTLGLVQSWCFLCRGSRLAEGLARALDSNEASTRTWLEKVRRCMVRTSQLGLQVSIVCVCTCSTPKRKLCRSRRWARPGSLSKVAHIE